MSVTRPLAIAALLAAASSASAALTLLSGPQIGTQVGNLVTNGSFEIGAPAPNGPITFWATGTANLPFSVPAGWSSSGDTQTYAYWGGNGVGPYTLAGSANLPDGSAGMYFGNGAGAQVSQPPTFNPNGNVTFPNAPILTAAFPQTCNLWQSVPTNTNIAPSYILSFWASGEGAGSSAGPGIDPGIFGLRVTNVLPGDPIQYLTVPGSSLGQQRYEYQFTPINPFAPVTVEFINWGHFDLTPWGGPGFTTELVLDDVIVNTYIPTPGALALFGVTVGAMSRRRRR